MKEFDKMPQEISRLSRRRFVKYGAIALGTGILTACSRSTSESTAPASSESPAASGGILATIKERGYFTYGLEAGYRPFEFYDENNELVGYDIDLAMELGKRWGVESRPTPTNWPTVIQTLYNGGFDFILGGMTATAERYERVNFSVPYMDASSGLLIRSGEGIAAREDLNGRVVGTKAGTPSIDQLTITEKELNIKYREPIKTFADDTAGLEALRSKRIDAYASSIVSMLEFAKVNPGFEVIPFQSESWAAEYTCAAFRKEDEDLRTAFNDAIAAMKQDGTLYTLQMKWFQQEFKNLPDTPPTW
ncbi:amino acid ABC transporter substrate-binding protein [Oscillatoria sp. FACHB-1407]|uniref:ABC transporter substrate-binding protein n=1 Tax=Oscillatoria sp. FACHB-1407 TaxID=2692847 RepID=UPI001684C530|nr:transporter substrate-binding domain-containing protein [Oscillatoria sp. FACHB-1407]MBD2459717.1 amino acid ABC transporter substrate-binding protein [Oscillatoria sp. FACHB-1407]